ncbi:MAG: hypothetical protein ABFS41_02280 [Myxococcota bacterium]
MGQLLVAPRAANEPFNPAERRLLQNIARQASNAVHASQLTNRLQRSRERLVTAREEERRRQNDNPNSTMASPAHSMISLGFIGSLFFRRV